MFWRRRRKHSLFPSSCPPAAGAAVSSSPDQCRTVDHGKNTLNMLKSAFILVIHWWNFENVKIHKGSLVRLSISGSTAGEWGHWMIFFFWTDSKDSIHPKELFCPLPPDNWGLPSNLTWKSSFSNIHFDYLYGVSVVFHLLQTRFEGLKAFWKGVAKMAFQLSQFDQKRVNWSLALQLDKSNPAAPGRLLYQTNQRPGTGFHFSDNNTYHFHDTF